MGAKVLCSIFGHRWLLGTLNAIGVDRPLLSAKFCPRCNTVEWID